MNNKKQKIALVTGAIGFVGSYLARRLVKDGWDVHVMVRPHSKIDIIKDVADKITIHKHDGTTEAMIDIMSKAHPEIVFHLASLFLVQHQSKDIEPLIRSNILYGSQLVEAMVANGVYKLVNTGTSWQHYNNEDYNPVNLYAATKQAFEAILRFYIETTPLRIITLKLFDTYGPNDPRPKLFNLLKKVAKEQKPLAMSPGEQLIDIVYIDDVVEAFVVAAERLLNHKAERYEDYAVSSGNLIRLRELVETYEKVIGKKLPIEWGERYYREREVMVPWKMGKLLIGWKPEVVIVEGIKRLECRIRRFLK